MSTTAQAFAEFLTSIEPTPWQLETLIPARKNTVVKNLETAFPSGSDMPFSKADLIGSAAKSTIIRPIDDIDVLAVFSNAGKAFERYQYNSRDFLYRVRRAYDGLEAHQVGARGQAVRVFFDQGGHVDVAPVFFAGGDDYLLPAGDGSWIRTSPLKQIKWFNDKNADLSYHLRPRVRLLKAWNHAHSSRLKSFHLETVTANVFSSMSGNHRDGLAKFFEWAQTRLTVSDPGGHGGDLSGYLSWSARQDVIASFASARTRAAAAQAAEASGNHAEAKRLWRIVLGSDFPA